MRRRAGRSASQRDALMRIRQIGRFPIDADHTSRGPGRRKAATYASPGPVRRQRRRTQPRVTCARAGRSASQRDALMRIRQIGRFPIDADHTSRDPGRRWCGDLCQPWASETATPANAAQGNVRRAARSASQRDALMRTGKLIGPRLGPITRRNVPAAAGAATYASPGPVRRQRRRTPPRVTCRARADRRPNGTL